MKLISRFLLVLLSFTISKSDQFTYLSPGFLIGINFDGAVFYGPKISYGLTHSKGFRNITIGYLVERNSDNSSIFIEGQSANYSKPVLLGGGVGLSIPYNNSSNSSIVLRLSTFAGYVGFVNNTILISNKVEDNINGELVIPFPVPFKAVGGGG
ncbi:MAG TPA: hypothetical protein VNJ29_02145 [Candidatus Nitrosotenuis sp.]|nr:hypothetical protein [Candidatus Nitrosotenuis sp.]